MGPSVDLLWIPLGAGASVPLVRWNGRAYEALAAWRHRRARQDLRPAHAEADARDVHLLVVGLEPEEFQRRLAAKAHPRNGRSQEGPKEEMPPRDLEVAQQSLPI